MRETIDTTYADLRPSDLVIDKSGQAWPIKDLLIGPYVTFWLLDPVSKVPMHLMNKGIADPVKVSRLPTQADEASKLEAGYPVVVPPGTVTGISTDANYVSLEEAVANVMEYFKEATVEAEVTAAEVDAAAAATDDAPVTIIPFADMTPLEQRSHCYLLHGIFAHDLQSKAELAALHDQAHAATDAGTLNSRHVPHNHE